MKKRVLVTGSRGFTGRYMVSELMSHGYEVFGTGSHESDDEQYYQADLQDAQRLRQVMVEVQPDIVIHLAALAFVGHGDPNAFYQVNLIGTRNLLEAIEASGKKPDCVLLASSANVYGNQAGGVLSENTLPAPANDYAVSKLAMEYMAHTWMSRLPIVIARPFNYTGVGQADNFLLPKIVSHFRRQEPVIELGNLDVWRDFSDVRTVVSAYRSLVECCPEGQTFNIASGKLYSLREIIAMCERVTDHNINVTVNPAFVRANEVKELCGDATRLTSLVGDVSQCNIEETLRWMLD